MQAWKITIFQRYLLCLKDMGGFSAPFVYMSSLLFCFSMTGYGFRDFVNSQLFLTLDNLLHYFLFFVVLFLLKGWERSKPTTPCCKDINKFPNEERRFSSGGNSYNFHLFLVIFFFCFFLFYFIFNFFCCMQKLKLGGHLMAGSPCKKLKLLRIGSEGLICSYSCSMLLP